MAKAKAKTPAPKEAAKEPEFTIVVNIDGAVFKGEGATGLEALQAVKSPTNDLISTGSVTITHGDKQKVMLFPTQQLRRLLNPYNQEILINDLVAGL